MYAGKRYNSNLNYTKRLKLDRVAPVDYRPPTEKNGGPKQLWYTNIKVVDLIEHLFLVHI